MKIENNTDEYLEAIYKISDEEEKVTIAKLAQTLNIRPQSAREKINGLDKDKYINYSKDGITLTDKGIIRAKDIIRKHRLAERFLKDSLGLDWDEVHEEACLFEHIMSQRVADALEKFLNYPSNCPHGHPIPSKDGQIKKEDKLKKLSELHSGAKATVKKIDEQSSALLKQLMSLGILPECKIELKQIAPFHSAFMVEINNLCCYSIGQDIAKKIWVSEEARK